MEAILGGLSEGRRRAAVAAGEGQIVTMPLAIPMDMPNPPEWISRDWRESHRGRRFPGQRAITNRTHVRGFRPLLMRYAENSGLIGGTEGI
jgi:hypothetical protein